MHEMRVEIETPVKRALMISGWFLSRGRGEGEGVEVEVEVAGIDCDKSCVG